MGGSQSAESVKEHLQGKPVVTYLESVANIILIDRRSYGYHNVAAPRATVDSIVEARVAIPPDPTAEIWPHNSWRGGGSAREISQAQRPREAHPIRLPRHRSGFGNTFPSLVPIPQVKEVHEAFQATTKAIEEASVYHPLTNPGWSNNTLDLWLE